MTSARISTPPDNPPSHPAGRRLQAVGGCALAIFAGAIGFLCTWTMLTLGTRGELVWRLGQPTELRVWLLRGEDLGGLGWSRGQVVDRRGPIVCVRTLVGFWTWRGAAPAPNSPTCDCFQPLGGAWIGAGACP